MNAKEFENKVAMMRRAQKEYFRNKSRAWLEDSKRLEREVDAELEIRRNPDTQQALFEAENQDGDWKRTSKELPHLGEFVNCIYRHGIGYQVSVMQVKEENLQDGLLLFGCAECIMWQSLTLPNIRKEEEK